MSYTLTHLGGHHTVTGSCHLLQIGSLNILIDCGLAQGDAEILPLGAWPISPADIDYLFLTHAHIDHIGRLPELIQQGFRGEILATDATVALLGPMFRDAVRFLKLSVIEGERLLENIDELVWEFEYDRSFDLKAGIRFRFGRAGHILGSCWIRFEIPEGASSTSVIFSGDLGARHTPILPDPDVVPEPCDLLILESTYGDRNHGDRTHRVRRLGQVLTRTLADSGKVFIPAFALGRTQELLYEMDRLFSEPRWRTEFPQLSKETSHLPVFIDSPLGQRLTTQYARLSNYWDNEARALLRRGDHPIDFDQLYAIQRYAEHRELLDLAGPAVILAGSGMCTGGRIVKHLQEGLADPKNDVLFVGYQAAGTPGRDIITYSPRPNGYVVLDREKVPIRAGIHVLSGYSAHADQQGLIEWVEAMPEKPGAIRLVHGEPSAQQALRNELIRHGYAVET